ncbi:hypothetical protein CENSYa_1000 [Cenarchaeum symbiosum A]|uniref:Uncharacterized protein n=1 Tax=Cenarchaeum symbiosum (strain A) TaxID=414004 RepID=A0RWB5_CENSY|nr:hypothetical protein CENSYa_1000 [Cenarchaeum symbiosum A]
MSDVRVTYSGLISLALGLLSALTGLIFVLIMTRSISEADLSAWTLIGGLFTYVLIIEPVISYWNIRQVARGGDSGRTAVLSGGLFASVGTVGFVIMAYFVFVGSDTDPEIILYAAALIPLQFLNSTLASVALGWRPHMASYGLVILDLVKIPTALLLVYQLDWGITGVIVSLAISYLVVDVVLAYLVREKLRGKFSVAYLRSWARLSWLPLFERFPTMVMLEVVIFSAITGGAAGLAHWTVALTSSSIAQHASRLVQSLHAKLLGGGSREYLQESLALLLYFALPFMAVSIVFAEPIVHALNPVYAGAVPAARMLAVVALLANLDALFINALRGIEKVDMSTDTSFRRYLRSDLFRLPKMMLAHKFVYWAVLAAGLALLTGVVQDRVDLVVAWSVIALITHVPFTAYFVLLARRRFAPRVDAVRITKYAGATAIVYAPAFLAIPHVLEYDGPLLVLLPALLGLVALTFAAYVLVTYAVDAHTRRLVGAVLGEVLSRTRGGARP